MPNNTISGSFPTEIRLSAGGFLEAMIYKFKIELCRPVGANIVKVSRLRRGEPLRCFMSPHWGFSFNK